MADQGYGAGEAREKVAEEELGAEGGFLGGFCSRIGSGRCTRKGRALGVSVCVFWSF